MEEQGIPSPTRTIDTGSRRLYVMGRHSREVFSEKVPDFNSQIEGKGFGSRSIGGGSGNCNSSYGSSGGNAKLFFQSFYQFREFQNGESLYIFDQFCNFFASHD